MIDEIRGVGNNPKRLIITPNRAMSWEALLAFFFIITTITVSIGLWFFVNGFPFVLPYAGVEMCLLGYALYITAWNSTAKEVITIDGETIAVEKGHKILENTYQFHQAWTKVILEMPDHTWHPSRLVIRSKGLQLEIGKFLNEEERRGLAKTLVKALAQT